MSEFIGAFANQPTDLNFLTTHRFQVVMSRCPGVVYFTQEANLPGLSMNNAAIATPFVDIPMPGDKIRFEPFALSFPVDQQLQNWKEIGKWLTGMTFPKSYGQYADLVAETGTVSDAMTDISLYILDSKWEPQHLVTFKDAFPISLSAINFNTKVTDTELVYATATFVYSYYDFEEVNADSLTVTQADHL